MLRKPASIGRSRAFIIEKPVRNSETQASAFAATSWEVPPPRALSKQGRDSPAPQAGLKSQRWQWATYYCGIFQGEKEP